MENNNNFIKPEEISVSNLFDNIEYVIPIYQRNYAWGEKEITQLLIDINDSKEKSNYYLGNLIVDKNKPNSFYVIDGQQRLTTLFLLFKCLYENDEKYKNNWYSIQNSLRFEAREISNIALKNNFDEFNSNNNTATELKNGYSFIKNYIEINKIDKNDFLKTLERIKIIRTQVPENIDLNHYFEIMNTRGEQLELHEKVKSNILSTNGLEDFEKKIIAKIWDACSQMNTYVQMNFKPHIRKTLFDSNWNEFNHDKFEDLNNKIINLKNDCIIKLKNELNIENTNNSITNYILENIFEIDGDKIIKKIKEKIDDKTEEKNNNTQIEDNKSDIKENSLLSILRHPEKYIIKKEDKCNSQEENERFESIISFPIFLMIVNEIINMNGDEEDDSSLDDKRLLVILEKNWSNKENAKRFIYSLLKYRFLFDKYIIKREFAKNYKDTGKWSLQKLEKNEKEGSPEYSSSFSQDNQRIKALQSVFRITYTSPKTMHWISKILSKIDINEDKDEILGNKIINILENYACNKIDRTNYKSSSGFGFSRIIFTYLDYLLIRDKDNNGFKECLKSADFGNFEFQFRNSIEHFSPQTGGDFSDKDKYDVLNSFGNLALITVSGNSKFSNMTPNQKIDNKNESIVKQSPKLMIMASYCNKEKQWNEIMVEKHKNEMFKILEDELINKLNNQMNNSIL